MQRSSKNEADEYDLEGVTARLASMEARRRRRKDQKNADAAQQQQELDRKISCGFDLAPAELSSGGSDSDDDCCSSSTNSLPSDSERGSRAKAPKLRVVDSLDLSMSVATFGGELSSPRQTGPECIKSSSTNERPSLLKLPSRKLDKAIYGEQIGGNTVCGTSRIPKLVERRRQMQAVGKPANEAMNARKPSSVAGSNNNNGVENDHSSASRGSSGDRAKLRHSTQVPTRKPNQITVEVRPKDNEHASVNAQSILDDIDFSTAEERQLLQSLEKLNQRLSHVSTPAVVVLESGHQENQSELHVSAFQNSSSIDTNKNEVDEKHLRAAAYGGGTHCKLRQPSSASLRSSFVKRAELSEGIHKARVRVGGATVHDGGRNNSVGGVGKHKIVVKKDLAHLLF